MTGLADQVQMLADRQAIADCVYRYADDRTGFRR
jgi:hypothetical protein